MKNNKTKNNIINFPNDISEAEREVEAILFSAEEPLDIPSIESKIKKKRNVKMILDKLKMFYSKRGINLICLNNKWSFRTAENLSKLMSEQKTVQKKLSKAAIETLAIIVYHQPVTRAEIEEIRGVSFGTNTLEILLELNWVKPEGRKDVPGRPIQYGTTEYFLNHFNLKILSFKLGGNPVMGMLLVLYMSIQLINPLKLFVNLSVAFPHKYILVKGGIWSIYFVLKIFVSSLTCMKPSWCFWSYSMNKMFHSLIK